MSQILKTSLARAGAGRPPLTVSDDVRLARVRAQKQIYQWRTRGIPRAERLRQILDVVRAEGVHAAEKVDAIRKILEG